MPHGLEKPTPSAYRLGNTVTFRTNAQLEAEKQKLREDARPKLDLAPLAKLVLDSFLESLHHRERVDITNRLESCTRQRKGKYEPSDLAKIQQGKGTELFFNITETKCVDAEAWIKDLLAPSNGKPWGLEPTPVPELPADEVEKIGKEAIQVAIMEGMETQREAVDLVNEMYDTRLAEMQESAKNTCLRMERVIEDQLIDGCMMDAFHDFLNYFCTYPTAFLKGPILQEKKQLCWENGQPIVKRKKVYTWSAPHPKDIYPAPNVSCMEDGYICEVVPYTKSALQSMRGMPGWSTEGIDAALRDPGIEDPAKYAPGNAERALSENRDTTEGEGTPKSVLRGIEYWGDVEGKLLKEAGINLGVSSESIEDTKLYPVTILVFGQHVVRAVLNPDPAGGKSYYAASYESCPGSIWGKSLPEKMEHFQRAYNTAMRILVDNMALASGPMVAVDSAAMDAGVDCTVVAPRKVYSYDSTLMPPGGRRVVEFFQPNANASELLPVASSFENGADNVTGIPRFSHGDGGVQGAGETSSGLAMLMNNATKGIKNILMILDKHILRPAILRMYLLNMLNHPDPAIKGDAQIKAEGAIGKLIEEQEQIRQQEFMNLTNNPIDQAIIGLEGRRKMLERISTKVNLKDVVPSEELFASLQAQQALMAEEGEAPTDEAPNA